MRIDGNRIAEIQRVLVYTYIYEGVANWQQADAVLALGAQYGWQNASCRRDYSGNDRAILLQKPPVLG